jgi:hypothetical protein
MYRASTVRIVMKTILLTRAKYVKRSPLPGTSYFVVFHEEDDGNHNNMVVTMVKTDQSTLQSNKQRMKQFNNKHDELTMSTARVLLGLINNARIVNTR